MCKKGGKGGLPGLVFDNRIMYTEGITDRNSGGQNMKNLRFISAVAAACALFASQPALAAEMPFDTYGSAVITAGQGAAQGGGA